LALRLVLRGDHASEYDQGKKHQNQFLYGHHIFSFQTKALLSETLSALRN